jgi:peptide/nickel transport system substrate-binding protein
MSGPRLTKRAFLGAGAAGAVLGAIPRSARAAIAPLIVVLESEVVILDPHATTAAITRSFGYHVFDTLFSMDAKGQIRPQMVEDHTVSADGLAWDFTLREGLAWHDGAPVTASDCIASLKRWSGGDSLGRRLAAATATMEAKDARRFTIALKEPFPLMLDVLGKPNAPVPFMMPARIMPPGIDQRIKEIVGSGPFRFRAEAWKPGDSMTLARFEAYKPRPEPADFLAGGKVVKLDQVVLKVMPDDATAVTALLAREIDYMQYLPFDWLDKLGTAADVKIMSLTGVDMFQGNFRLNAASGPFADEAVRRVMWKLVDQTETLQAIGIPERFTIAHCPSFFMCDAPLSTDSGATVAKLDIAEARRMLAATSYKGEPVVMLQVSGSISQTAAAVLAQHMREAGFTVDEQVMDWGTVLTRRGRKEGWSLYPVYSNGIDMVSPLTHFYIGSNCADYSGWSCDTVMTGLLTAYAKAPDEAVRKRIAVQIQEAAYRSVPAVMWGQFARPAGYRSRLTNLIPSSFPMFWNASLAS